MNYIPLLCCLALAVGTSAYAIEGRWQSTDHNNAIIAVSSVSTDANGVNSYNLGIEGCSAPLSFAIVQSYLQISNLGKQSCSADNSGSLMKSLQEKFFYFKIFYDQLLLVNIYGNKSLSFTRVKIEMRNYNLPGVFSSNGSTVTITNQSIFLCSNSLQIDYSGNSKDSIRTDSSTISDSCPDAEAKDLLSHLQQAEYYRLENPNVLRFYGANYSQVAELNQVGKWNGVVPLFFNKTGAGPQLNASNHATPTSPLNSISNAGTPSESSLSFANSTNQSSSSPSDYTSVKPSSSMVSATWYPEYFVTGDQSTWPSKFAINGSSLAFIGCNPIIVPMTINYTNLTVSTGNAVPLSRKPSCGTQDQAYIDLIKKSNSLTATANETAFKLNFYDKNNQSLFVISRNMSSAQKRNIVFDATNPTDNTRIPNYQQQPIVTNTATTTQSQTSTNSPPSSTTFSNNTKTATANSYGTTTAGASTTSSQPSSSAPSSASSSSLPSSTTATAAVAASTSILVGRYNPSKVGLVSLPSALTSNIFFIFTPTIIFVTGTCNSYVYPYNMDQKGAVTLIAINTADKQIKTNPNCDSSDDLLFIQPFEKSSQITLSSSSINGVGAVMNLMDTAGNPTISLKKVS